MESKKCKKCSDGNMFKAKKRFWLIFSKVLWRCDSCGFEKPLIKKSYHMTCPMCSNDLFVYGDFSGMNTPDYAYSDNAVVLNREECDFCHLDLTIIKMLDYKMKRTAVDDKWEKVQYAYEKRADPIRDEIADLEDQVEDEQDEKKKERLSKKLTMLNERLAKIEDAFDKKEQRYSERQMKWREKLEKSYHA
jgi:hypothetical protein